VKVQRILVAAGFSALAACANFSGIAPGARRLDPQTLNNGSLLEAGGGAAWPRESWGAVVTVECHGRRAHRYEVSLGRYHAVRQWVLFGGHPWQSSGSFMRSSMATCPWTREVSDQRS